MLSCWQVDVKLSIAMHLQITFGRSAFNRMYIGVNGFYSAFNVRVNTISQIVHVVFPIPSSVKNKHTHTHTHTPFPSFHSLFLVSKIKNKIALPVPR